MSLLIKGLNIPKNCLLCPCCVGEGLGMGRQHYCQVIDDEPCVSETYRPKNCPLVGIPTPHGRLIDADKLMQWIEHVYGDKDIIKFITDDIKRQPTIVEADLLKMVEVTE